MSSKSSSHTPCVVCGKRSARIVRNVPTQRTDREIPLYCCTECFSFFNPSGYREDAEQLKDDLEWNIGVIPRNEGYARQLFEEIKVREPEVSSVLEVGCGIGTALHIAENEFGISGKGFDVNKAAVEWGKEHFKVDLSSELWDANLDVDADLITCISCLEHVEQPRGLLKQLAERSKSTNKPVFISVPFLEVHHWKFLDDPDPGRPGTPFFDNDVHVTHFSVLGLINVMRSFGLERFSVMNAGWMGILFHPETTLRGRLASAKRYRQWRRNYLDRVRSSLNSEECPECLLSLR